jgi:hypothetical protein
VASIGAVGGLALDILHISLIAWEVRGTLAQRVVGSEGENHLHDSNRWGSGDVEGGRDVSHCCYMPRYYIYIFF